MTTTAKKLTKLRRTCDRTMQEVGRKMFPKSIISGKPTEVLHHFFPKSTSASLRYNWDNLIPLTNGEHMQHHLAGDPSIHATIIRKRGQVWYETLDKKRHDIIKVSLSYYQSEFERLNELNTEKEH